MGNTQDIVRSTPIDAIYPKRVVGGLEQVYNGAKLSVVRGGIEQEVLRSGVFLPHLPLYPYDKADPTKIGEKNAYDVRLLQTTAGLLIPSTQSGERYMTSIGGQDYANTPRIADMIVREEPVALRIVFGGSEEIQLRALGMLIPALQQIENIGKQPADPNVAPIRTPQLQVVFAHHIAEALNKRDMGKMQAEARRFIDIAEAYTEAFFPAAREALVFLEDAPMTVLAPEMKRLSELANAELPAVLQEKLHKKQAAEANGNSLLYTAAHLMMHDSNNPNFIRAVSTNKAGAIIPTAIVSLGGRQEADFYESRLTLKSVAGEAYQAVPTLQFITNHKIPPYARAREGDISLAEIYASGKVDLGKIKEIDPLAVKDLMYLYKATQRRGKEEEGIDSFLKAFAESR